MPQRPSLILIMTRLPVSISLLWFFFLSHMGITQGLQLSDITVASGIPLFGNSHGVAVGDYNNDGFEDLYISVNRGENRLYRNNGNGTFQEVETPPEKDINARTKAAVWGDINNDHYLDLYLANLRANDQLFLNNGDGSFTEITVEAGIWNLANPSAVNMADVNNDGYLDIYISNLASENVLYLNNKDLSFRDYTFISGAVDAGSSMGTIFFDYDKDGDQDLYLVHDHAEPNFLYQNDGEGQFIEVGAMTGANVQGLGMGVDVGDVNNDGFSDIYITNLFKNILLLNKGDGTFLNISKQAGIEDYGMGWGTTFWDYNKDGQVDIFVANDSDFSPFPNVLYQNQGDATFIPIELDSTVNWGQSYAIACLDYNLDGNMDFALANKGDTDPFQLFKNTTPSGNWIGIKLFGVQSNSHGVGAKVQLFDHLGRTHFKELTCGHGWASQNSGILYFGLGEAEALDSFKLYWPSGLIQDFDALTLNRYYTITEGSLPIEGIVFETLVSSSKELQSVPSDFDFQIFPNPNHGSMMLNVNARTQEVILVEVFDMLGKPIYQTYADLSGQKNNSIDLHLNTTKEQNFLIIRLSNGTYQATQKLILIE